MSISAIWEPIGSVRFRPLWLTLGPLLTAILYYLGAEAAFAIGTLTQQFDLEISQADSFLNRGP